MFDKTRNNFNNRVNNFKNDNKRYSDQGREQAKKILRSRTDEHKNEYMSNSDSYEQAWKEQGEKFKHESLTKQIIFLLIVLAVILMILWGWLG